MVLKSEVHYELFMTKANRYHSYNVGELPDGCKYCVKGEKLVVFVTGLCPRKCYFCPISDEKYQHDVSFANERKMIAENDLLTEAQMMDAKGAGITGGDPLARLDKTVKTIRTLKEKYGKRFHIHLYTSLNLVTTNSLRDLYEAGLDEIRFHLDFDSEKLWPRLSLARNFPWKVGVELPVIPTKEKELLRAMDFASDKVDSVTLNELEVSDNSQSKLLERGFRVKKGLSYAVEGSLESGLRVIEYMKQKGYTPQVHLCTAKLKDGIQLARRLQRESKRAKKAFDVVNKEGLLTRGALYLPSLVPGFGYRKKLAVVVKEPLLDELAEKRKRIMSQCKLEEEEIFLDQEKVRLLLSWKKITTLKQKFHSLDLVCAIVKEYPTADQLEIDVEIV